MMYSGLKIATLSGGGTPRPQRPRQRRVPPSPPRAFVLTQEEADERAGRRPQAQSRALTPQAGKAGVKVQQGAVKWRDGSRFATSQDHLYFLQEFGEPK